MTNYWFNTQNHVRIWFSGQRDTFLNVENQLRFVHFREKNPTAKIVFLYSSSLLQPEAIDAMKDFCKQHHLTPLDFDTELLAECTDPADLALHEIARMELDRYRIKQGGNLAAASDAARLISKLLQKGTYSDFDTQVHVDKIDNVVKIKGPMLFNRLVKTTLNRQTSICNNDIIGIATTDEGEIDPSALKILQGFQENIIATYHQNMVNRLIILSIGAHASNSELLSLFNRGYFIRFLQKNPQAKVIDLRQYFEKSTQSIFGALTMRPLKLLPYIFKNMDPDLLNRLDDALNIAMQDLNYDDFPDSFSAAEQHVIKAFYMNYARNELLYSIRALDKQHSAQSIAALKRSVKVISNYSDLEKAHALMQSTEVSVRDKILLESVTLFSGPIALEMQFAKLDRSLKNTMSFVDNNLLTHFYSEQIWDVFTPEEIAQLQLTYKKIDSYADLSWIQSGQNRIKEREAKLHQAASIIQAGWKNKKNNNLVDDENASSDKTNCRRS